MKSVLRQTATRVLTSTAALLLMLAGLQACTFTTANIERAVMARSVNEQSEPMEETDTFHGSESLLHCSVLMANTPEGTPVKAVWYQEEGEEKNVIDSTEITMDNGGWIDFTLALSQNMLPYGEYGVDLYIGSAYARTVPFTVTPMYPDSFVKEAVIASALSEESYFPTAPTRVFEAGTDMVYAPVYVSGQPAGTVFGSIWYAHDANGERVEISSAEIPFDDEGWIGFSLNLPDGLAPGRYSVDILINGEVEQTLEFSAE